MDYLREDYGSYRLHLIKTEKFKLTTVRVSFRREIKKDEITIRNVLTDMFTQSSANYNSKKALTIKAQDLYAADIATATKRIGNYINTDISLSVLNDKYTEKGNFKSAVEFLSEIIFKPDVKDSLNRCLDNAMKNFPKLYGKTICLSDNSGSAWGTVPTQYGSVKIAEIDNLSSVMTAYNSDEGYVGVFGDNLEIESVNKRDGVLSQLNYIQNKHDTGSIGGGTENGIWIFFRDAIKNKVYYDNIFIYSDQQAGHGELYGVNCAEYSDYIYQGTYRYIDVLKLVQEYRRKVNPRVNVFSVQTAGYNNSVLPENEYRTSILTGWTGNEVVYAKALINIWDRMDSLSEDKIKKIESNDIKIKTRP